MRRGRKREHCDNFAQYQGQHCSKVDQNPTPRNTRLFDRFSDKKQALYFLRFSEYFHVQITPPNPKSKTVPTLKIPQKDGKVDIIRKPKSMSRNTCRTPKIHDTWQPLSQKFTKSRQPPFDKTWIQNNAVTTHGRQQRVPSRVRKSTRFRFG